MLDWTLNHLLEYDIQVHRVEKHVVLSPTCITTGSLLIDYSNEHYRLAEPEITSLILL